MDWLMYPVNLSILQILIQTFSTLTRNQLCENSTRSSSVNVILSTLPGEVFLHEQKHKKRLNWYNILTTTFVAVLENLPLDCSYS